MNVLMNKSSLIWKEGQNLVSALLNSTARKSLLSPGGYWQITLLLLPTPIFIETPDKPFFKFGFFHMQITLVSHASDSHIPEEQELFFRC